MFLLLHSISTLDSTFLLDMVKALIRNDKAIDERMGSGDDDATVQLEVVERVGKAVCRNDRPL